MRDVRNLKLSSLRIERCLQSDKTPDGDVGGGYGRNYLTFSFGGNNSK